jgi:DNA polymerase III subunit gamma/tau
LLICRIKPRTNELLDIPAEDLAVLQELAAGFSAESLYRYFQLLLQGVEEMHHSSHPRLVLEMTFIKATQAGQVVPVASLIEKVDDLLRQSGLPSGGNQAVGIGALSEERPVYESAGPPVRPPAGGPATTSGSPVAAPMEPAPAVAAVSTAGVADRDVRRHWEDFLDYVKERKQWMAHALRMSSSQREEEGRLLVKFDAPADCKMLQEPENLQLLSEFAQNFFQRELPVRISTRGGGESGPGPAQEGNAQEERRSLASEPLVHMAAEVFGGQVVNIRTGPRNR